MSLEVKVKGSVRSENIFKDQIRKEELVRVYWGQNWQWYVDLLRERERAIADLKKSSPKALVVGPAETSEQRTVRPFPLTSNREYGWLSSKNEFKLEVFGSYFENTKLSANVPEASSSIFYSTSDV